MNGVNTRGEARSKTGVVWSTTVQGRSATSIRSAVRKPSRPRSNVLAGAVEKGLRRAPFAVVHREVELAAATGRQRPIEQVLGPERRVDPALQPAHAVRRHQRIEPPSYTGR